MAIAMGSNLSQLSAIPERHITIQLILSIIFLTTSTSKFLTQGPVKLGPSLDRSILVILVKNFLTKLL